MKKVPSLSEKGPSGQLRLRSLFVDVVDAHQRAGEGGDFPERDEERFMDLAFGVNEDTTEEEDEAAKGQNCGSYELDVELHRTCEF